MYNCVKLAVLRSQDKGQTQSNSNKYLRQIYTDILHNMIRYILLYEENKISKIDHLMIVHAHLI